MTDEKPDEARRGREEEGGAGETNAAGAMAQLKKLEVFISGRSIYTWETVTVDDYPYVIVVSKTDLLLWGMAQTSRSPSVERLWRCLSF